MAQRAFSVEDFSSGLPLPEGCRSTSARTPKCAAFAIPETLHRIRRPNGTKPEPGYYLRVGTQDRTRMKCGLCGGANPLRSNEAIAEELKRLSTLSMANGPFPVRATTATTSVRLKPNLGSRPDSAKHVSGTPHRRYNACRKTFSEAGAPQNRQRKPSKNRDVFMLLMNKSPIRRIAEVTGLDVKSIYGKISLIHKQCQTLAGHRELQLMQGMTLPAMYLAA